MNRVCFTLRVKPSMLEEYRQQHQRVWPEMLEALSRTGWHNYSLFLEADGMLVGYFETPGSLEEAVEAMSTEPINARWQDLMAPYFEGSGDHADQMMRRLDEVFHLP
jgi:L-rhamnose mutarotase